MQTIFNFLFDYFFLFLGIGFVYYSYRQYTDLKERTAKIYDLFKKTLYPYLDKRYKEAKDLANSLKEEYGHVDKLNTEIDRLLLILEKSEEGTINELVEISNLINKFKIDKKIDSKKYPRMLELNDLTIFKEEEMESLDNGLAIARKEYNTMAFRYNEKANSFPMNKLATSFKLNKQYKIFDALKTSNYDEIYEVFEEQEPEIHSLTVLNYIKEDDDLPKLKDEVEELTLDSDDEE